MPPDNLYPAIAVMTVSFVGLVVFIFGWTALLVFAALCVAARYL